MKVLLSLVIAVIFSLAANAQEKPQTVEERQAETYQKALKNVHYLMFNAKTICKSRECRVSAVKGRKLVLETVSKGQQGLIGQEELKKFHADLQVHLKRIIVDLNKQLPKKQAEPIRERMGQFPSDGQECELCSQLYEIFSGICTANISPAAGAVCLAVLTARYIACLDQWCANGFLPNWFVDNFDVLAGWGVNPGETAIDDGYEYTQD